MGKIKEPEPFSIESEIDKLEKESKHRFRTFLIAILIIAIIGAGIYFLIIKPPSKSKSPNIKPSSVAKTSEQKKALKQE